MIQESGEEMWCRLYGLNALPSFPEREVWEVSAFEHPVEDYLRPALAQAEGLDLVEVSDQIGMVTPRIVCSIINEAYRMWQEGTASQAAINSAMKYGTNYPHGPFEWAERIGIEDVYHTLKALADRYGTERFPIAGALESAYFHAAKSSFPAE
jgi:3-hydroxybutyryl-CoA dehydrogenase